MFKFRVAVMVVVFCLVGTGCVYENPGDEIVVDMVESPGEIVSWEVEDFSVITIGTGTPEYSEVKAKACTAVQYNGQYYILDMGDGVFENLESVDFDYSKIGGLFFTHHHVDHTTDFFDIYMKCLLAGVSDLKIVGPPRTGLFVDFFDDVYLDDVLYRKLNTTKNPEKLNRDAFVEASEVIEVSGEESFMIGDLRITTAEMTHTMYDLAYRFDVGGYSVVVSGDTSYDEDLIVLSKDADILVVDGNLYKENESDSERTPTDIEPFYEFGGDFDVEPHLSFDDMVTIAVEANVGSLVITHYGDVGEKRIESSINKIEERFDGQVYYATDMMEVKVDLASGEYVSEGEVDGGLSYPVVDTNQTDFYSDEGIIERPEEGEIFYGQDGNYEGNQPSYTDNGDGTVTDNVTGLMWAKSMGDKMSYEEAEAFTLAAELAGYDDWRIPTIKELYSLIQFDGRAFGEEATETLFIDTSYFDQPLGDTSAGEREIDAQTWSSTFYEGETMNGDETLFGVNFVDGRIKGYPVFNKKEQEDNEMYFRRVRGNTSYGINNFVDNGDGTVTDMATGLTWQQGDSGSGMEWQEALEYAENLDYAGYDDWRLPNAKELQSIVDYNRSLQSSDSAAIDPVFNSTAILDPEGNVNYPYYWTGTTHLDGKNPYTSAVYIAFGEALGEMNGKLMDVHGAGASRSDPKIGSEEEYPKAVGPQGDIRFVFNFVRCVRED